MKTYCTNCGKGIGFLSRGSFDGKQHCSTACRDEWENKSKQEKADMIESTKTKKPQAEATEAKGPAPVENKGPAPTENKGPVSTENKAPKPAAGKKPGKAEKAVPATKKPAPAPKKPGKAPKPAGKPAKSEKAPKPAAAPKKAQKPASASKKPTPKPVKVAKAPKSPVKRGPTMPVGKPYRPDTIFARVFDRLQDGKEHTLMSLFQGENVGDPSRILGHIISRGKFKGEWLIERTGPGRVRMTKAFKPAKG